jgi:hypothetical protein
MLVSINNRFYEGESVEGFGHLLNEIDGLINAEVELASQNGKSILFLKSAKNALLVYFTDKDDDGIHSVGDGYRQGKFQIHFPHDDISDEYHLAWCIELESAYKALSYFFVNDGEKPPFIVWHEN